ncbi:flagellar biosynthesis regulator FlaF [Sandaracinobacteroides saxicola]|uniref:Flagellar biosynthesis regulator FlaF n=2 Tax=Sandaracinobacteroides saxicola TaxID=2759707 RepID=A0A7G5IMC7_9SPHN|nr:flagellar biosynthesis regulator FlaF [Sandaracinobacteroides saxicola]
MSINAYRKTTVAAETPQQMEQRALSEAIVRLRTAQDQGLKGPPLVAALEFNRELWRLLANDCLGKGNGLPAALRAAIVSIALWVQRHSSDVAAGRESVSDLIDVNQEIARGLAAQSTLRAA